MPGWSSRWILAFLNRRFLLHRGGSIRENQHFICLAISFEPGVQRGLMQGILYDILTSENMYDLNIHKPVFSILNPKQLAAITGKVAFDSASATLRCCLLCSSSFIFTIRGPYVSVLYLSTITARLGFVCNFILSVHRSIRPAVDINSCRESDNIHHSLLHMYRSVTILPR
jgi:hypothetical protein